MVNVMVAAMAWWEGKRPTNWTVHTHLRSPGVNCSTRQEHELANACAAFESERIQEAIEAVEELRNS